MKKTIQFCILLFAFCIFLTGCALFAQDDIDNAVNEATAPLDEQITELEADIADKTAKISTLEGEKSALTTEKAELEAEITALEEEKAALEAELEADITALEEEKAALKAELEAEITALEEAKATLEAELAAKEIELACEKDEHVWDGESELEYSWSDDKTKCTVLFDCTHCGEEDSAESKSITSDENGNLVAEFDGGFPSDTLLLPTVTGVKFNTDSEGYYEDTNTFVVSNENSFVITFTGTNFDKLSEENDLMLAIKVGEGWFGFDYIYALSNYGVSVTINESEIICTWDRESTAWVLDNINFDSINGFAIADYAALEIIGASMIEVNLAARKSDTYIPPTVTGVTFNTDSEGYDKDTNTFVVSDENSFVITFTGTNLDNQDLVLVIKVGEDWYFLASYDSIPKTINESEFICTLDLDSTAWMLDYPEFNPITGFALCDYVTRENIDGSIIEVNLTVQKPDTSLSPTVTGVTFNTDSEGYDKDTNTFLVSDENSFVITFTGTNFDKLSEKNDLMLAIKVGEGWFGFDYIYNPLQNGVSITINESEIICTWDRDFAAWVLDGYNPINGFLLADHNGAIIEASMIEVNLTVQKSDAPSDELVTVTTAEEFLAAIEYGGNIKLGNDITISSGISISKAVTLNLNGKTLTSTGGTRALNVAKNSTLYVFNGTIVSNNGIAVENNGGTVFVENCTLTGDLHAFFHVTGTSSLKDCTLNGLMYTASVGSGTVTLYQTITFGHGTDKDHTGIASIGASVLCDFDPTDHIDSGVVTNNNDGTWTVTVVE